MPEGAAPSATPAGSGTGQGGSGQLGGQSSGMPGRYATALYEYAEEQRNLDEVIDQAASLVRLIDQSAPLRGLLATPTLDIAQSRSATIAVLEAQGFGATMQHFVGVIANNRRLPALRAILIAFAAGVASRRGITVAQVASAHALTDLQRTQLRARLAEAGYGRVDIHESVDQALLGGLVVRIGARLYDASLKSRLARLHYAMKGAA